MTYERIVEFTPAWDKRDPDPSKNFGIHGVELRMVLKGAKGAVQFVLYTNWMLPAVRREGGGSYHLPPMPADLGYHWHTPRYVGQEGGLACEYTHTGTCYYDGSGLNAERIYEVLLREGSEGVWKALEAYYEDLAGDEA